jgi:hypothetical protein
MGALWPSGVAKRALALAGLLAFGPCGIVQA